MAGAYCKFCQQRCFVLRTVPSGPRRGWTGQLATCPAGMEWDRKQTGHDHATALNPHFICCYQSDGGCVCGEPRDHDGPHRPVSVVPDTAPATGVFAEGER